MKNEKVMINLKLIMVNLNNYKELKLQIWVKNKGYRIAQ